MKSDSGRKIQRNCGKYMLGIKSGVFSKTSRIKAVAPTTHFSRYFSQQIKILLGMSCAEWLQSHFQALCWKLINTVQSAITGWRKSWKSCNYTIVLFIERTTILQRNSKLIVHLQWTDSWFLILQMVPLHIFIFSGVGFYYIHSVLVCKSNFMETISWT